jgi:hypothetical protein
MRLLPIEGIFRRKREACHKTRVTTYVLGQGEQKANSDTLVALWRGVRSSAKRRSGPIRS